MQDFWIYAGVYFFLAVIVLGALVLIGLGVHYISGGASPEIWRWLSGRRFRIAVVCVLFLVLVLIVVFLGLVLAGFSPGYDSRSAYYFENDNCDRLLRDQLIFQRGASTAGRMNEVVRQIQAQRAVCVSELWDPLVVDRPLPDAGCVLERLEPNFPPEYDLFPEIGAASSRDSENNIFVYWHPTEMKLRPGDGAICWVYVALINAWYVAR